MPARRSARSVATRSSGRKLEAPPPPPAGPTLPAKRKSRVKSEEKDDDDDDEAVKKEDRHDGGAPPAGKKRKTTTTTATTATATATPAAATTTTAATATATTTTITTTTTKKTAPSGPLAPRTDVSTLKNTVCIGAHVSAAGGVHNSIPNAVHIGANAIALFLKSQRKWTAPPLDPAAAASFRALAEAADQPYSRARHVLPHGSYLVNLAQPDPDKAAQAYDNFVDDLRRCASLGVRLYNFHPGSAVGGAGVTKEAAIGRIAAQLNKAHAETAAAAAGAAAADDDDDNDKGGVVTVLENMAGSGNVIGSRFEELRDIIALVENKDRVGVCIDTCHAFAAGYDLRSPEAFAHTMAEFDRVVGLKYLKALHLNDSKAPLGSNRDLHANIGTGFLGLRAFHSVVNYAPFAGLPMVLETPIDRPGPGGGKPIEDHGVWAREIKLLEGLVGADPDAEEFKNMERELQEEGAAERSKIAAQVDKKQQKKKPQQPAGRVAKGVKGAKDAKGGVAVKKTRGRKAKAECDSCDEEGEEDEAEDDDDDED